MVTLLSVVEFNGGVFSNRVKFERWTPLSSCMSCRNHSTGAPAVPNWPEPADTAVIGRAVAGRRFENGLYAGVTAFGLGSCRRISHDRNLQTDIALQ